LATKIHHLHLVIAIVLLVALSACSSSTKAPDKTALEQEASVRLQAVPPASPEKYRNMPDMKNWRNPYLIVLPEGVGLLDPANNEQRLLKTGEVLNALAALPPSAWPYGRVVVVTENAITSTEEQRVAIRRNKGILAGTLEGAHVLINWVPSA
jgi:hypothetical protein